MAAGYDGSIRIQTKIDQSGFDSGVKSLKSQAASLAAVYRKQGMSASDAFKKAWAEIERSSKPSIKNIKRDLSGLTQSLKGVAAAAGIAFGIGAIINFSKESVKATNDLTNAMMGLQSIMDGQGRSFAEAQKFINEYVSDGLIPATQAITAYKNLALRGYDDSQIQKVLVALKDSAAFGRQASYSLGEAVQSATEGLKNENSILVDNAGVTKNVAKMWDDYAKSIGTTANNLTQQQKIQAEVTGILEESKYQVGDAAKVANSYSGEILKLSYNFNNLKIAIGNALIPIARAVLPSINSMILGLTRLANVFAQVSTLIFGKQQNEIAESGINAAKAETGLAKATEKVGTASKKASNELKSMLANFDEINVIAKDATGNVDGIADAIFDGGIDTSGVNTGGELFGDVEVSPKIRAFIDDIKDSLSALKPYIDNAKAAWDRFKDTMIRVWEKIEPARDALARLFSKVKEMAGDQGLDYIAGSVQMLAGALDELSGLVLIICGLFTADWDMAMDGAKLALKGLGEIIEGVLIILLGRDAVEAIKDFLGEWKTRISRWWTEDVKPWFTREKWAQLWKDTRQWWADGFNGIETDWASSISGWWSNDVTPWFTKDKWLELFVSMRDSFMERWSETSAWWSNALSYWWANHVTPWFAKSKWIEIMAGVKEGFAETFKNAVNAAIELFNKFIGWINSKMRFEWDPVKVAGKTIVPGGSVQLFTIPAIPKLATGAVIPPNAEFMAILGDQTRGRNIEAPEGLIRQIIQEELSNLEMGGGETTIRFEGSMGQLIRVMKPHIDRENNRRGKNLIKGAPA